MCDFEEGGEYQILQNPATRANYDAATARLEDYYFDKALVGYKDWKVGRFQLLSFQGLLIQFRASLAVLVAEFINLFNQSCFVAFILLISLSPYQHKRGSKRGV